jgi:hypothetical protein
MNAPVKMDGIFTGEHGTASMVGFAMAILATALLSNYWAVQSVPAKKTPPADAAATTAKTTKKRRGAVCPFSAESNFLVETAEHLPPSPLDLHRSWIDEKHPDFGKPLAARWLNAGISGQDTPGMLRAGLKRLRNAEFFLVEESYRMREELLMKAKALDDPVRFPTKYVQEDDSVEAQLEVVELFLSYLPKRYPALYTYNKEANTLYVKPLDQTFVVDEWKERPLEFCERIVQEDLVIMRPSRPTDAFESFAMAAAGVVFSFSGLQEKLSQPIEFIHAPVPGYEKHLRKTLNLTFGKLLKEEQPMWRNNWGISASGDLDNPLYGTSDAHSERKFSKPSREEIKAKFLKVEYQTIRRLPKSGYLLFTVKTMADRMDSLEDVPAAAKCLATSIRGMSAAMQGYKGIEDEPTCEAVLAYLDDISGEAK